VYERHANVIVNYGRATARDVLRLADEMRRRVRDTFGIELEPEVKIYAR
jgi:UDP-N-acetylmuramate dehydrogenase